MESLGLMDLSAFRGKRVLVSGHTGFKGAWLVIWLQKLGAQVTGVALDPVDDRCIYSTSGIGRRIRDLRCDIRDEQRLCDLFAEEKPEIVFHLAAQALVLESYRQPIATFEVNVLGTANVLEAIRRTGSVRSAVMVTTDKCYENREWPHGYRETDALGGHDPYSASKGAAEVVIASYRRSFFAAEGSAGIASARSGNVIGGGDESADRLVPDLFRAVRSNKPLLIRNPGSVRPWQHVLEPLHGYLLLADRMLRYPTGYAEAWNFGPSHAQTRTVRDLADAIIAHIGRGEWREAEKAHREHEANLLMLDINKAVTRLGWKPRLTFAETVRFTADHYMRAGTTDVLSLCHEQIAEFERLGDH